MCACTVHTGVAPFIATFNGEVPIPGNSTMEQAQQICTAHNGTVEPSASGVWAVEDNCVAQKNGNVWECHCDATLHKSVNSMGDCSEHEVEVNPGDPLSAWSCSSLPY